MLTLLLAVLLSVDLFAQPVMLVDFGPDAGGTTFGLAGWNRLLLSNTLAYSSAGPGGLIQTSDSGEYADFRGVSGTLRRFAVGERIVVTWYNSSDEVFRFTARISFTDADRPQGGSSAGNWYTMRSFDDYRLTYIEIQAHSTARTVFNITDHGVHESDSLYSLVNINTHIEWFQTAQKQFLLCDRIELWDDADCTPPEAISDLRATPVSHSRIDLDWDAPHDNIAVAGYLVYLDGEVEGNSEQPHYAAVLLEPTQPYSFAVTAVDAAGNESTPSRLVIASTQVFNQPPGALDPAALIYLGAFRLPETFSWGGEAMAFHGDGDPGSTDDFPGSLYITDLNQVQAGFVGEVNIPAPVSTTGGDVDALPEARLLTAPVNIRPASINDWGDYVDIWRTGLEYLPSQNRLYSVWSVHYTVTGEKHASLSCTDAGAITSAVRLGAWYLGDPSQPPIDAQSGDYLFALPQSWADEHVAGRSLVAGRFRDGGLSGLGPTLYAVAPVGAVPPPANTVVSVTPLLQYGSVEAATGETFPDAVLGYRHSDSWRDAAWVAVDDQAAVMIVGNKAFGEHWYGYRSENMRHDWVIADEPMPNFYATDPDGKGWRSQRSAPMAIFYDPHDLQQVASGAWAAHEPQPYAARRFDPDLFYSEQMEIRSMACDAENGILYLAEFDPFRNGLLIVHAWKIESGPVAVPSRRGTGRGCSAVKGFALHQNYPNPFNAQTTLEYDLPRSSRVQLDVFDIAGRQVVQLVHSWQSAGSYRLSFEAADLPSGIYVVRLQAGTAVKAIKVGVVK